MKQMKKMLSIAVSAVMLVQLLATAICFAEESTVSSVNINFNEGIQFDNSTKMSDNQNWQCVGGQYLKNYDDKSFRMYTLGGIYEGESKYVYKNVAPVETTAGQYGHISFEYLAENYMFSHAYLQLRVNGSYTEKMAVDVQNTGSASVFGVSASYRAGEWTKYDFYFENGTNKVYAYVNGAKINSGNPLTWSNSGVFNYASAFRIQFNPYVSNGEYKASALGFDSFISEAVTSLPETTDYRYRGETIDFDDYFDDSTTTNGISDGKYKVFNPIGNLSRFHWTGRPAIRFWQYGKSVFETGTGIFGKPDFDKSINIVTSQSGDYMQYNTKVDLQPNEIGHLSMMVASKNPTPVTLTSKLSTFGTVKGSDILLFSFGGDLKVKFFGTDTGMSWTTNKWYKVDFIIKNGNGTNTYAKVDCYLNGVKKLADYEWKPADGSYGALKYIGDLYTGGGSTSLPRNYYIDDLEFGVYDSIDNCYLPAMPGIVTTDSELSSLINSSAKAILPVPAGYTVENFLSKVSNPQNITVYDADGDKVIKGEFDGCFVKVSNGFGGGEYYSVSDHMTIDECSFEDDSLNTGVWSKIRINSSGATGTESNIAGTSGKIENDGSYFMNIAAGDTAVNDSTVPQLDFRDTIGSVSGDITIEASIMPVAGLVYYGIAPNSASATYLNNIIFKPGDKISVFNTVTDIPCNSNEWYRIVFKTKTGTDTAQVYINGELKFDDKLPNIAQYNDSNLVHHIVRNRIALYNSRDSQNDDNTTNGLNACVGIDNLRMSVGEAYDNTKDSVSLSSDIYPVDNNNRYIGVEDCESAIVSDLENEFDNIKIYKADSYKTQLGADDNITVGDKAVFISESGKTIAYYTIVEAGDANVLYSEYPVFDGKIKNVTVGEPLSNVIGKKFIVAPGNTITVTDSNGEAVDLSSALMEKGLTFTIKGSSDESATLVYTTQNVSEISERTLSGEINENDEEQATALKGLTVLDAKVKISDLEGTTEITALTDDGDVSVLKFNENGKVLLAGTEMCNYTVGATIRYTVCVIDNTASLYVNGVMISENVSFENSGIFAFGRKNTGSSHLAEISEYSIYLPYNSIVSADIIDTYNAGVVSDTYTVVNGAYGYIFTEENVTKKQLIDSLVNENAVISVVNFDDTEVTEDSALLTSGMKVKCVSGNTENYYTLMISDSAVVTSIIRTSSGIVAQTQIRDGVTGKMIAAVYDKTSGKLVSVNTFDAIAGLVKMSDVTAGENEVLKVMIWNDLDTAKPMGKVFEK